MSELINLYTNVYELTSVLLTSYKYQLTRIGVGQETSLTVLILKIKLNENCLENVT